MSPCCGDDWLDAVAIIQQPLRERADQMRTSWAYIVIFGLLYAATVVLFFGQPSWLVDLRNFVFDRYQSISAPVFDPATPVRIVAIDERSLLRFGQWPWPRTRVAEVVQDLSRLGAATVAFDMVFAEPDSLSLEQIVRTLPEGDTRTDLLRLLTPGTSNDARLAQAFGKVPTVVGATAVQTGAPVVWPAKSGFVAAGDAPDDALNGFAAAVLPLPILREAADGIGVTNWLPDRDQIVRRVPLLVRVGDAVAPSLAMEALRLAQGASTYVVRSANASGATAFGRHTGLNAIKVGDVEIDTSADGSIRPRYTRSDPGRYISAADVLDGTVSADVVRGRIILVGTPVTGLGDVRATPLEAVVPGVEIHAQVLEQLLSGQLLSRPDWAPGLELFVTLVSLAALALLMPRLSPSLAALLSAGAAAAILSASWLLFSRDHILFDPAFPCLMVGTAFLSGASSLWQTGLQNERQVRRAFGKFVSPAVVSRIAGNPQLLVLSGETRELTILFSDIRGFSTICEALTAREVADFLNGYLTPMTDAILAHDGTIDKYIGDAIVAFWNAPLDVPDHTRRAVEAVLAMRLALDAVNAEQERRAAAGHPAVRDLRMGVGLNRGPCSVGNMGSVQRFDYSALGDPMNVAARLEALTKLYAVDVLVTAEVVSEVPGFAWLEIDDLRVKGRSGMTRLFALVGDEAYAASPAFEHMASRHATLRAVSAARDFHRAAILAHEIAEEVEPRWRPLYVELERRCAEFARNLPRPVSLEPDIMEKLDLEPAQGSR